MAACRMICRKAFPQDRPELLNIWEEVFGDGEAVANRLMDGFAGYDNIYVAEEHGAVISQLLAVPCEAGGQRGAYLYGLATLPEFRGRGVMSKLMDHAEEQVKSSGGSFFILIPASSSLFDYYSDHGFETACTINLDLDPGSIKQRDPQCELANGEIGVDHFVDLRSRYGSEATVNFSKDIISMELEEQWYYGCRSVYCQDGYAIYMQVGDILFITEMVASSYDLAMDLIAHAGEPEKSSKIKITLSADSPLFKDQSHNMIQTPQFQYKWWGADVLPDFYLRFAMDDLPARIKANKEDMIK